jgi:aspartyl-tRNA(Asn)/glutamyl-tRNA(Gln) amidotransferase subunit C
MLAMSLTESDVRHVARLARLGLAPGEAERFRAELEKILDHVSAIATLDLDGVPATSHPLDLVNVLADDVVLPGASTADALANAPDPAASGFRVPPIGA